MSRPAFLNDNQNPAKVLNRVAKLVTRYFDRRLIDLGMNVAHLAVLGPLSKGEALSQKELAASTGSSQAAMAELLSKMVKDGLLSRQRGSHDRRLVLFSLTPSTISRLSEVHNIIAEGNAAIFADLGASGIEDLLSRLAQIEQRLDAL